MDNEQKPKARNKYPDRVTLSPESLARLGVWMTELEGHLKGNRVTRNDLVNFLILSHSSHLSEKEVNELSKQNFDEVQFAEWALRQLKEAKALGRDLSLADILKEAVPVKVKEGGQK